jgi:hypothetical protein
MLDRGQSRKYSSLRCRGEETRVVAAANGLLHHVCWVGSHLPRWLSPR